MKRKYEVTYPDKIEVVVISCEYSFGETEGKKWIKEKHPEVIKIKVIK